MYIYNMLTFESASGHVFYLNNAIAAIVLLFYLILLAQEFHKPQKDKGLHSLISAILTGFLLIIFHYLKISWWISPIITFIIGIGKEIMDLLNPKNKKFDFGDLFADFTGVGVVSIVYCLFVYF